LILALIGLPKIGLWGLKLCYDSLRYLISDINPVGFCSDCFWVWFRAWLDCKWTTELLKSKEVDPIKIFCALWRRIINKDFNFRVFKITSRNYFKRFFCILSKLLVSLFQWLQFKYNCFHKRFHFLLISL
jgi:hypothetical protein